ncbi:unnamed protein product, partial [Adineta ricciae]
MTKRRHTTGVRAPSTNADARVPCAPLSETQSSAALSDQQLTISSRRSSSTTTTTGQQSTTSSRSITVTALAGEQSTAESRQLTTTTTSSTEETARTSPAERITNDTVHEEQSDSVDRKSHVWEYFERCQDPEVLRAKCFLCEDELRTPNYATSSLIRHLEQRHNLQQAAQIQVLPVQTKSNKLSRAERKRLDSLPINAIIQDGRSYGDLHKSGMKKLIDGLQP